jgi:hypothetical protein
MQSGTLLSNYFKHIIAPFEEVWVRNIARHQQQSRQAAVPMIASHNTGIQQQGSTNFSQPSPAGPGPTMSGTPTARTSMGPVGDAQFPPQNVNEGQRQEGDPYRARSETHMSAPEQDVDEQGLKRKREESVTADYKRLRMSTGTLSHRQNINRILIVVCRGGTTQQ